MEGKEVGDVDCDGKVGCDCAAAFDGINRWTNCRLLASKERESTTDTIMELNNNILAALVFIILFHPIVIVYKCNDIYVNISRCLCHYQGSFITLL